MRPLFIVVFVPSNENDTRIDTAVTQNPRASACCRSAMAVKETASGASEIPRITPVSWTGKNPFGMAT